ncbi:MAG TPA: DegV family protein [Anaerolineales bacterium]
MPTIAVLTDSTASLPEAVMKNLHITTVAYYIHRGQEVLRDLVTIQPDEFLSWLPAAKVLPTTAAPGPGDYLDAYQKMAEQGIREIISIHMSAKISAAYEAATVARSMLRNVWPDVRVEVIDSRNAALSQGWMVIEAARGALAGVNIDEITARVRRMIPITHMIQTADTLKYLYMGGRIGRVQTLLGTMLHIKPLVGLEDGELVPLGKARSRGQAYAMMADIVAEVVGRGQAKIGYLHAGALKEAERLKELVEAKVEVVESFFGELSPALAVHTGPGMAGLCYYPVGRDAAE